MTLRANVTSRRSRNAKSLSVTQTQDYDSESEAVVTSTSGQKPTTPATKISRQKLTSRSPGSSTSPTMSTSPGSSRSPGASRLPEISRSPGVSRLRRVSKLSAASESDIMSRPLAVSKSPTSSKFLEESGPSTVSKSLVVTKSLAASQLNEATKLCVTSKALGISRHQPPSRKRRHVTTVVKQEHLPDDATDVDGSMMQDQSPGCQRLLMREWLLQEVELGKIPGLDWLDEEKKLIRIPWIHASKDGWSQDSHSRLFENWAIYTGKYDPSKQKPDPKRWKANFRCALNSLPDITEQSDLGKKNGMDGYRVYRVNDAVDRKGHRKHKIFNRTPPAESRTQSSFEPNQPPQQLEPCRTSPVPIAASSSVYADDFTDSQGNSILVLPPSGVIIACSAELISDTVCPSDGMYTSLSNIVAANENYSELAAAVYNEKAETSEESVTVGWNCTSERDIVSLRNLDHNYFKLQIPTTVENFVDNDPATSAEQNPKTLRKNDPR